MIKDEKKGNLEYARTAERWKERDIGTAMTFEDMAMDERKHQGNLQIILEKLRRGVI
jgi:rubrerythrin